MALDYGLVEIYSDDSLGVGSYGKVCRAKCGRLHCAAKLLHDTMFEGNDPGTFNFTKKFEQECQFLSTIRHPNIVQYICTTRHPTSGRPVLLMELMDENLTHFLERSATISLPYHTQIDICHDVALALAYLHYNAIIHRDLSSNNVLLIGGGSRAKVTDFGMSKFTDMNTQMTLCPGTIVYMAPEALKASPQYTYKLDCFSFGVLTIQILTKRFPNPGKADEYVEDQRYPNGRVLVQFPEFERRKEDINLIEQHHPLLPIIMQCIQDRDVNRPSAGEFCDQLALRKKDDRYMWSVQQSKDESALVMKLQQELQAKNKQISAYLSELDSKEKEVADLRKKQHLEVLKWKEMAEAEQQKHEDAERTADKELATEMDGKLKIKSDKVNNNSMCVTTKLYTSSLKKYLQNRWW